MTSLKKALLPYGTTSSSPSIVLPDTALFLSVRGSLTKSYFENSAGLKNRVTGSESMVQQRMGKSDEQGILIGYWQQADVPLALQLEPEVPLPT